MLSIFWFTPLGAFDLLLGATTFTLLLRSRSLRAYWPLLYLTLWQLIPYVFLLWLRKYRVFSAMEAYSLYFYVYWVTFACSAICSALLTYTIFQQVLHPLKGLTSLGKIMFRWILGLTIVTVLSSSTQPESSLPTVVRAVSGLQRISGVVVLGLVLFVVTSIRPLGLTLRSRSFGVSLGVFIAVLADVIAAGYMAISRDMFNTASIGITLADCAAQMIWIWYLAVPEPTRKFLLLPTTSPFHQWNLVSERMGYDPGYVAIGGVPPDSLASAELELLERIAQQNAGTLPMPEADAAASLPAGTPAATMEATERFHRSWNFKNADANSGPAA